MTWGTGIALRLGLRLGLGLDLGLRHKERLHCNNKGLI